MILFYDIHLEDSLSDFSFSKEESKHLSKVLRKKAGDPITITNGKGLEWNGELTHVASNSARAKKTESHQHSLPKKQIHLAIAPTKNNNRMEWLIEKLTELGVASITPLLCQHSERKVTKALRFEKIAIAALKQSQQFYLPEIRPLISFTDFLKNNIQNAYIAHCQKSPKLNLTDCALNQNNVTLLIGPEGDFSREEIDAAEKAGLCSVSIGSQRFRTETAGLLACHTVFLQQQIN
jgi:16S rRNA (uracil1498-N3)-methyltransferase